MQARFLRPAELEVDDAVAYFDEQRQDLGDRFEQDLLESLAFIKEYPLAGKALTSQVRKFRLRRFRFNLIYVVHDREIVIVAVAHQRRRPGYWRNRVASLR